MRYRYASALLVLMIAAAALAAVIAGPADASPSQTRACTGCHSGAASGTVTATPSTTTPAAGAAYTVAINVGLASSGNTGYHVASTDAAGATTTWVAVSGGPAAQTSWTANMTAPAAAGTYYYQVWCVKGPASSSGQTKVATYSITVPAPPVVNAALSTVTPNHAQVGSSVTIAGTNLGSAGAVRFGATSATTTAWSATSITAIVPASLAPGATTVTVTPTGGAASNALAFTVDAPTQASAVLTSLSPNSGPVGTTLTITGTGLGASGAVTVGGIAAPASVWSTTSVTCTVPVGLALGSRNVVVTPTSGAASNALPFSVTVAPPVVAAITGLTPTHAQTGASVVIAGTNLGTGGVVRFGDTPATTTAWSTTSVTAVVPASLAVGAANVTVTPTGGANSNTLAFTVDAQPVAVDTTAPTTTAAGPITGVWCNDVVTVTLAAADNGGSGVASIIYRVDGGAPVTVPAASVVVPVGVPRTAPGAGGARAVDGAHTIEFYATDLAGNLASVRTVTVNIDTCGPATLAPSAARVKQRRMAVLRYEVRDATPSAGTADVTITLKDRRGRVVKRLALGSRPVNTALTARFRCALRPGTYRFSVRATDAAGNPQANVASQKLTVR
jgi:hypothetical protein